MNSAGPALWRRLFVWAALFNFAIGIPIIILRSWTYELAFRDATAAGGLALELWGDFGVFIVLIGAGYLMIARDPPRQRMLAWLGVCAKGFDVVILSWRTACGITNPVVLLPAAVDAAFLVLFLVFLHRTRTAAIGPGQAAAPRRQRGRLGA